MRSKKLRNFAFELYEDSCNPEWKKIIEDMHIKCVWIYHDRDVTEDGEIKKSHYHVMIMWSNNTTHQVVREIVEKLGAANNYYEVVNSRESYARYMCHIDNPEKYQHSVEELQELGGAGLKSMIKKTENNKVDELCRMIEYCQENCILNYAVFVNYCMRNNREWMKMLMVVQYGRVMQDYIKAFKDLYYSKIEEEREKAKNRPRMKEKG